MVCPTNDHAISPLRLAILSSARRSTSTCAKNESVQITRENSGEREGWKSGFTFEGMTEDLQQLYRLFWAGARVPIDLIDRIIAPLADCDDQRSSAALCSLFSSPLLEKFPVKPSFRQKLLKQIVQKLEKLSSSVPDSLYDSLGELMSIGDGDYSYRVYLSPNGDQILSSIREHNQQLSHGTTGLSVWQASCDLANLLYQYVSIPATVLELGAGCGLSGIVASRRAPHSRVVLSDYDTRVLQQLQENVDKMKVGSTVAVQNIDWCNFDVVDLKEKPQLVIAADVVYDRSILLPLCNVIQKCLLSSSSGSSNSEAIIASTLRDPETLKAFEEQIVASGMEIAERVQYHRGSYLFEDGSEHHPSTPSLFPHTSTLDTPTVFFRIVVCS